MAKNKKNSLLGTSLIILIVFAIIGLAFTGVKFIKDPDPTYASTTLQLSFDGAAQGLLPNGAKYNVQDMISDQVLEEALAAAGMKESYTAEQIRENLTVTGVYPEDIVKQAMSYESLLNFTANRKLTIGDYFPTTYGVSLKNEFDHTISQGKLEELLKQIMAAFQANFIRLGSSALNSGSTIVYTYEDYDYTQ